MATFVPQYGVKLCPPLEEWRPDEPNLWPHCDVCRGPIKVGMPYAVAVVGNAVFCKPCTSGLRGARQ